MNFKDISDELIKGNDKKVYELTQQALDEGSSPKEILDSGYIPGMATVGKAFKECKIFLPEVLISARAMKKGMELIQPLFSQSGEEMLGNIVIGTVKGDLHDIGKNIVSAMLEGAGFRVIDIGADVPAEKFCDAVVQNDANFVGMSALLTTTMVNMKQVIDKLSEKNIRDKVKVLVGGAPLTKEFAVEIGADGYASDAPSAVEVCKQWLA